MAEMTAHEARQITSQLQSKTQQLAKLIKKAHDGKVWEALGYKSFSEWANKELPFTHGRAFQLLNIGVLTEELTENVVLNEDFILTDKQARGISWFGREEFMKAYVAAAGTDGSANAMLISKLINARAAEIKATNEEEEEEKPRKARATIENENTTRISSGDKNSRTILYLGRTLRTQTSEFPRPDKLSPELRDRGLSLLLDAKSSLEKTHDELIDLLNKKKESQLDLSLPDEIIDEYVGEMANAPVEAKSAEKVNVND